MSGSSSIEWTDATWNPVRGCSAVSPGCANCYAAREAVRHAGPHGAYEGLATSNGGRPRWTGDVVLVKSQLDWPLRWRGSKAAKAEGRPSRIFVNSMSDLFHERLSDEEIGAVFGVMAAAPQHTFQVLTKRAERARRWFEWMEQRVMAIVSAHPDPNMRPVSHWFASEIIGAAEEMLGRLIATDDAGENLPQSWPLPNVWLGVSAENQETADERIPHLLATPAAVRFVSYEPALKAVDFERFLSGSTGAGPEPLSADGKKPAQATGGSGANPRDGAGAEHFPALHQRRGLCHSGLDWLIVGGESGPGARPFDIAWARTAVEQCRAAGVPVFVKQLGARPRGEPWTKANGRWVQLDNHPARRSQVILAHRKGGDWSEWPEDLRVREFPR